MHLVLDPSVVIKWYVPEVLSHAAARIKRQIHEGSRLVAVPQLFFVESANVLWKKAALRKELSQREGDLIFSHIMDLPFHVIEDREILSKARGLAATYLISVYDALYLACAIQVKAVLITADSKLVQRFADSSISRHITPLK